MHALIRSYPDWKAPAEDGKLLIWPPPDALLRQTRENLSRLSRERTQIGNVPLHEIRRRMRDFIGHDDANEPTPLLASGHQSELYHPGVWAKDALIQAIVKRLGGRGIHIAVDTDAPKHLILRWPGRAMPITDDPNITSAAWCGMLASPSPAHVDAIRQQVEESTRDWEFEPLLPRVLDSLRRQALEANTLSTALTNSLHELDWELGLRHDAMLAAPIWMCQPYALFVHHILARADHFASDYSAALADHRNEHGVNSRSRPMPDLVVSQDSVEMPFWLDDLATGKRTRPSVFRTDGGWMLELEEGKQFIFDPSAEGWDAAGRLARWLGSSAHRLAPRALTLTLFFRLCLVDQFIHGIGGGRYDQVTDRLIARHFNLDPPSFAVTTATMFLPQALGRQRVCVPCVLHEGHRLRHSVLGERKMQIIEQIESLPRLSADREQLFQDMHHQLDSAARTSTAVQRWQETLLETKHREREEQTLFDRELFYALQPRERLVDMIEKYESEVVARATSP